MCFLHQWSKRRIIPIFPLLPDSRLRDTSTKKGGEGEAEEERAGNVWVFLDHTYFSRWVCWNQALHLSSGFPFMEKLHGPYQLLESFPSSWKWKQERASGPNVENPTLQWPRQWNRRLVGWTSNLLQCQNCSNEASEKLPRMNRHFLPCNFPEFHFRKGWAGARHLFPESIIFIQSLPTHHVPDVASTAKWNSVTAIACVTSTQPFI